MDPALLLNLLAPCSLCVLAKLTEVYGRIVQFYCMQFALLTLVLSMVAKVELHHGCWLLRAIQIVSETTWLTTFGLALVSLKDVEFTDGLASLVFSIAGIFCCVLLQFHPGFTGAPYPLLVREILERPPHRQMSRCRGG